MLTSHPAPDAAELTVAQALADQWPVAEPDHPQAQALAAAGQARWVDADDVYGPHWELTAEGQRALGRATAAAPSPQLASWATGFGA